ncbi:hypothetical protein [Streptomyces sp. ADI93-02]|uniref:hypothetical protein n=1 Tax=Streptomyces sp. ADI93-02 TaxID=1522757 RepID=UPI000F5539A9|nr:hypothetical protein [Streptomyces sp. ADI93-02]RPK33353.1 hypothetical protein EES40_35725 [Streptomyces sp. ADI93-02]
MPQSENSGTTRFTPETLHEYGNSEGYLPGMRRESITHQSTLSGYKTESGKLRAGNPNFGPAKAFEEAFTLACDGATKEFVFNDPMLMSFTETMRGNHAAFQEVEVQNLENNKRLGEVVSKDLQARMDGNGASGTGSPNPSNPTSGTSGSGNSGSGNAKA